MEKKPSFSRANRMIRLSISKVFVFTVLHFLFAGALFLGAIIAAGGFMPEEPMSGIRQLIWLICMVGMFVLEAPAFGAAAALGAMGHHYLVQWLLVALNSLLFGLLGAWSYVRLRMVWAPAWARLVHQEGHEEPK